MIQSDLSADCFIPDIDQCLTLEDEQVAIEQALFANEIQREQIQTQYIIERKWPQAFITDRQIVRANEFIDRVERRMSQSPLKTQEQFNHLQNIISPELERSRIKQNAIEERLDSIEILMEKLTGSIDDLRNSN